MTLLLAFQCQGQLHANIGSINIGDLGKTSHQISIPILNQSHRKLLVFSNSNGGNVALEIPYTIDSYEIEHITFSISGYGQKKIKESLHFRNNNEEVIVKIKGKISGSSKQDCADFKEQKFKKTSAAQSKSKYKSFKPIRIYSVEDKNTVFSADPFKYPFGHFVVLIDASGSMGGNHKLESIKDHLYTLIDQLRPTDYISIIKYNETSDLVVNYKSVYEKGDIIKAIKGIEAGGFTNGKNGIENALEYTREWQNTLLSNHVIMLTDGNFNLGSEQEDIISFLRWKNKSMRYKLSVMTIGSEKKNASQMKDLTKAGNGYFFNLDSDAKDKESLNKLLLKQLST